MKLTQAQRSVIERMAAGAALCDADFSTNAWMEDPLTATSLPRKVLRELERSKVVEYDHHFYFIEYYRLTDLGRSLAQQKTPPPPK